MKIILNLSNNIKGILLMLTGQLCFALNDTIVKYAVIISDNNFSTLNIIFIRGIFTSFFIFMTIIIFSKVNIKNIFMNKKSYLRAIFEVLTALFFFTGLVLMPVSNVYTLLMTVPFIVTIYSSLILKEKVGIRRWSAVFIGFVGVIIVINPQNLKFGILFLLPIISAFFLTMRDVVTKGLVNKNNTLQITLITSICVMLSSGIGLIIFNVNLDFTNLMYIFISSIFLTIAYISSILTIYYSPLSLTASFRYSVIIFGIVFGYLILGEIPSINMIIGAIIISFGGLFVIKREKVLGKIK